MTKTFVQLSADGEKAHWKFQAEEAPVFAKEIVLVDVTDLKPQPEEGWLWDGAKFTPPPPPPLEEQLTRLHRRLQAYIYAHYDQGTQASLTAFAAAAQATLLNPVASEGDKAAALSTINQIMPAWAWVQTVLAYYYDLKTELETGKSLEELTIDFKQFDAADPLISLQEFVKGSK